MTTEGETEEGRTAGRLREIMDRYPGTSGSKPADWPEKKSWPPFAPWPPEPLAFAFLLFERMTWALASEMCREAFGQADRELSVINHRIAASNEREAKSVNRLGEVFWGRQVAELLGVDPSRFSRWHATPGKVDFGRVGQILLLFGLRFDKIPTPDPDRSLEAAYASAINLALILFRDDLPQVTRDVAAGLSAGHEIAATAEQRDAYESLLLALDLVPPIDPFALRDLGLHD